MISFSEVVPSIGLSPRSAQPGCNVAVAMSGGVDSAVAAALLKEQGYQVSGITMKTGGGEVFSRQGRRRGCYGPGEDNEIDDAYRVAQALGIPFYVLDLSQEYKAEVLDYFCHEYISGRTPNPCIKCNRQVKFGALVKKARDSGVNFDYFATGHYARVGYDEKRRRHLLRKAKDLRKDQSYFLFSLSQEQLGCFLSPVGDYTKEEVRKIASGFGLDVNNKPESQDFIAGDHTFLVKAIAQSGPILDRQGNVLGQHRGIPFYTIGQRKGIGISAKEPLYVTGIDLHRNAIIVGSKEELYRDELVASDLNWIAIENLRQPANVRTKIRCRHQEGQSMITPLDEDRVHVRFEEPQIAIAPGQAVVFYEGDVLIGGGTIESTQA